MGSRQTVRILLFDDADTGLLVRNTIAIVQKVALGDLGETVGLAAS